MVRQYATLLGGAFALLSEQKNEATGAGSLRAAAWRLFAYVTLFSDIEQSSNLGTNMALIGLMAAAGTPLTIGGGLSISRWRLWWVLPASSSR